MVLGSSLSGVFSLGVSLFSFSPDVGSRQSVKQGWGSQFWDGVSITVLV